MLLRAADAWFDVCTSPAGRPLALAITDMIIEAGWLPPACCCRGWPAPRRISGVHAEPGE
jgi:hypothetical protein